jgi:hypothetical protein
MRSAPLLDATNNWWGAGDGPSGAGLGSGDSVSTNVNFTPFRSVPAPACEQNDKDHKDHGFDRDEHKEQDHRDRGFMRR